VRKIIAERMAASKRVAPHVTYTWKWTCPGSGRLRRLQSPRPQDILQRHGGSGCRPSPASFPLANASLVDEEIVYHSYINVGIAVALAKGLIVPVVKTPIKKPCTPWDWKSVLWPPELGKQAFSEDIAGGTFTVTNLGMYGIDSFTRLLISRRVLS